MVLGAGAVALRARDRTGRARDPALLGLVVRVTAEATARGRRVRNAVLGVWLLYPVVWLLGPEGFALVPGLPAAVAAVGLDLVLKPGVGIVLAGLE
nr:bacteriorhodopsin [Salinirubrum litoreum]